MSLCVHGTTKQAAGFARLRPSPRARSRQENSRSWSKENLCAAREFATQLPRRTLRSIRRRVRRSGSRDLPNPHESSQPSSSSQSKETKRLHIPVVDFLFSFKVPEEALSPAGDSDQLSVVTKRDPIVRISRPAFRGQYSHGCGVEIVKERFGFGSVSEYVSSER